MRASLTAALLVLASLSLAACGQTPGCRALTGGAIGASGGAILGAIGGNPLLGAAAGGVAGAAVGGLTSPSAVSAGPSPVCY
jgi:osmotically inducible lipoprotein OsmB